MQLKNNYKIILIFLTTLSFSSFILGYFFGENSSGAGTYTGDFKHIWKNLQIFLNNDTLSAINNPAYDDSRTPLAYILHKFFNPFIDSRDSYRNSVFIISLAVPVLFYICLKKKFNNLNSLLLISISSIIFLSPYYRTTSYWGLNENYGIIFLLLTYLFLNSFLENRRQLNYKTYTNLFLTVFFSSLCLYFDQKLIIIPIICFFIIILKNKEIKLMLFSIFIYSLLSIPYIYMIMQWNNLIPLDATVSRRLGTELFFWHIGYTLTMIAFYLFPLLFFKEKKFYNLIKDFFLYKKNYYLISLFFIYLFYLLIFSDFYHPSHEPSPLGRGFINKISIILFTNDIFREIFIYFSFFNSCSSTFRLFFSPSSFNISPNLILFFAIFSLSFLFFSISSFFNP